MELGNIYGRTGNHLKAVESFEKLVEFAPKYIDALYNLSHFYYRLNNLPKAIEFIDRLLKEDPNNTMALLLLDEIKRNKQRD